MSETDKLREQLKRANPDKKWAEQVDNMRPDKVEAVHRSYMIKLAQKRKMGK